MQTQQCISKVVACIKLLFGANNYVRVRIKNRKKSEFSIFHDRLEIVTKTLNKINVLIFSVANTLCVSYLETPSPQSYHTYVTIYIIHRTQ